MLALSRKNDLPLNTSQPKEANAIIKEGDIWLHIPGVGITPGSLVTKDVANSSQRILSQDDSNYCIA